jgi:hypothetical protein
VRHLVCVGFALDVCLGNTMIDALWRNYHVLLLRDCTYAIEIPGIDAPGAWTERWILYTECAIGCTATSTAWQEACYAALEAGDGRRTTGDGMSRESEVGSRMNEMTSGSDTLSVMPRAPSPPEAQPSPPSPPERSDTP